MRSSAEVRDSGLSPQPSVKHVNRQVHVNESSLAGINPRFIGFNGRLIQTHRALRHLSFPRTRWVDVLLVPAIICCCTVLSWPWITWLWSHMITFWFSGLGNTVLLKTDKTFFPGVATFPYAYVQAALPNPLQWWEGMLIVFILFCGTLFLPVRMLPLAYALRLIALVQLLSQVYFYFWAAQFPYQAASSISALMQASMVLIVSIPWIYALLYNIFDFGLLRKILLSLMAIIYLIVLTPLQYTFAAWVMLEYSLLWHPLIYLLGSSLIQFGTVVGFYSWAMSWERYESL